MNVPDHIPVAKDKRGKGPRTKKKRKAAERRAKKDFQAEFGQIFKDNRKEEDD